MSSLGYFFVDRVNVRLILKIYMYRNRFMWTFSKLFARKLFLEIENSCTCMSCNRICEYLENGCPQSAPIPVLLNSLDF